MLRFSPLFLILGLAACDSAGGPITEPTPDPQPDDATAPLLVQSPFATVDLDGSVLGLEPDGGLFGGRAFSYRPTDFSPFSSSRAGVWLGGTQDGMTRSSIVYWASNFTTDCGDGPTGVFALDADTTYINTEAWPRDLGAPIEADGSPRVYGDQMLWGSFCSEANPFAGSDGQWAGRYADPLQGLRMNVAAYRYRRADLAGAVFVRYEVTNEGASPISDLRVGAFSDTETPGTYEGTNFNRYSHDAVAFDPATGLSYVYQLPFTTDNGSRSSTWVTGTTFLDLPLHSHRILRRFTHQEPEGFGQGPASATEAVRALDGLSYAGAPMIDPATGQPSRFAFPTDPFTNTTGWLDGRDDDGVFVGADVRQLLAAGPVALGAGETLTFTVVWVTAEDGPTSFDSYQQVRGLLSTVRAERSLWDVGPAGA
jgi:hypothetical protein